MHRVEVYVHGVVHAVIAIADVLLMPFGFLPTMFCDEGVFHTVAYILRQTRLRPSKDYLEGFIVRRCYVVLAAT